MWRLLKIQNVSLVPLMNGMKHMYAYATVISEHKNDMTQQCHFTPLSRMQNCIYNGSSQCQEYSIPGWLQQMLYGECTLGTRANPRMTVTPSHCSENSNLRMPQNLQDFSETDLSWDDIELLVQHIFNEYIVKQTFQDLHRRPMTEHDHRGKNQMLFN